MSLSSYLQAKVAEHDDWIKSQDRGSKVSYDSNHNSAKTLSFQEIDSVDECRGDSEDCSDDETSYTGNESMQRDDPGTSFSKDFNDVNSSDESATDEEEDHSSSRHLRLIDEHFFSVNSESGNTTFLDSQRRLYSLHTAEEGGLEIRYDGSWGGVGGGSSEEPSNCRSVEEYFSEKVLPLIEQSVGADQTSFQNHLDDCENKSTMPGEEIHQVNTVRREDQSGFEAEDNAEVDEDKDEINQHTLETCVEKCDARIQYLETELKHLLGASASGQFVDGEGQGQEIELRKELAEAIEAAKKAESWWKLLDAENAEMQETLWKYHARVQELESIALELEQANREAFEKERKERQERKIFQNRNTQQRQRITQLERLLGESSDRENVLERKIDALEDAGMQFSNEIAEANLISKERKAAITTIQEELEKVNASAALLQESNRKMKEEKRLLEETISKLEERVRRGEQEMKEMQSQMQQTIQEQMETHNQKLASLESQLEDFAKRESQLRGELDDARAKTESTRDFLEVEQKPCQQDVATNNQGVMDSFRDIFNRMSPDKKAQLSESASPINIDEETLPPFRSLEPTNEEKTICFMTIFSLLFQLKHTENQVRRTELMLEVYDRQLEDDCSDIWALKQQNKELNDIVGNIEEMKDLLSGQKDILRLKIDQQDRIVAYLESQLEDAVVKEKELKEALDGKTKEVERMKEDLVALQTEASDAKELYQYDLKTADERIAMMQDEMNEYSRVVKNYKDELREVEVSRLQREQHQQRELFNLQSELADYKSQMMFLTKELDEKKEELDVANVRLGQAEENLEKTGISLAAKETECERIDGLESNLGELRTVIQNLVEERKQLIDQRKTGEAQSKQQQQTIGRLECAQAENAVQIGRMQKELVASAKALQESIAVNRRELGRSRSQIANLEEENEKLRKELERERSERTAKEKAEKVESALQRCREERRVRQIEESIKMHRNELEVARQRMRRAMEK